MHPTHPRRRPWPTVLLLAVTALALAVAAVVLVAPPVGAHPLGGIEPSNYRSQVPAVRPVDSPEHPELRLATEEDE